MVEVFKTNVSDAALASRLVNEIQNSFTGYRANFDLEDCDRILRIKSTNGHIDTGRLVGWLGDFGCHAEPLPDKI